LISREHAQIRYEDGSFVVYDLGSTGGTFVNNRKVDRSILHTGDIINIANTPVMFINDNPDLEDQSELETGRLSEHDDIG
jgi:pSer/pThr/pTyr-binding forkhead associated (FHA) protein